MGSEMCIRDRSWGPASQASKEKGEKLLETRVKKILKYVRETLSKLEELEQKSPRKSILPNRSKVKKEEPSI